VLRLAGALDLSPPERKEFLEACGFSDAPPLSASERKPPQDPLLRTIAEFLEAPHRKRAPELLRRALSELVAASSQMGLPKETRGEIKTLGLAAMGYFHKSRGPKKPAFRGKRPGRRSTEELRTELGYTLLQILRVFADGHVPADTRLAQAKETLEYAQWRVRGKDTRSRKRAEVDK
jgi:hypothetical protein